MKLIRGNWITVRKYIVSRANEFHSFLKAHAKQPFTLPSEIVSPANCFLSLEEKLFRKSLYLAAKLIHVQKKSLFRKWADYPPHVHSDCAHALWPPKRDPFALLHRQDTSHPLRHRQITIFQIAFCRPHKTTYLYSTYRNFLEDANPPLPSPQ